MRLAHQNIMDAAQDRDRVRGFHRLSNVHNIRLGPVVREDVHTQDIPLKQSTIINHLTTFKEIEIINTTGDWFCTYCERVLPFANKWSLGRHFGKPGHMFHVDKNAEKMRVSLENFKRIAEMCVPTSGEFSRTSTDKIGRRMYAVMRILRAGMPMHMYDQVKDLFIGNELLGMSDVLKRYIPAIRDAYRLMLLSEILSPYDRVGILSPTGITLRKFTPISIIFDESFIYHKTYIYGMKIIDEFYNTYYRVAYVTQCDGSCVASTLAAMINGIFFNDGAPMPLDHFSVIGFIHDGNLVNMAAIKIVCVGKCEAIIDLVCSSHAMDVAGTYFKTKLCDGLWIVWEREFLENKKTAANSLIKQLGVTPMSYSKTRWGSRMECETQLLALLMRDDFYDFIANPVNKEIFSKGNGRKLKRLTLTRGMDWLNTLIQFTARVILGTVLVEEAYNLEKEDSNIFELEEHINRVFTFMDNPDLKLVEDLCKFVFSIRNRVDDIVEDDSDDDDEEDDGKRHRTQVSFEGFVRESENYSRSTNDEPLAAFRNIRQIKDYVAPRVLKLIAGPREYLEGIYRSDEGRMNDVFRLAQFAKIFHPKYKEDIILIDHWHFDLLLARCQTITTGDEDIRKCPIALLQEHRHDLLIQLDSYKHFLHLVLLIEKDPTPMFKEFWNMAETDENLTSFCYIARNLGCLVGSSGYIERQHSTLNGAYGPQQHLLLTDIFEATLMSKFNEEPNPDQIAEAVVQVLERFPDADAGADADDDV